MNKRYEIFTDRGIEGTITLEIASNETEAREIAQRLSQEYDNIGIDIWSGQQKIKQLII